MLGAIIGDIIGSAYEWKRTKDYNFELITPKSIYTDDTVMTVATIDAITSDGDYSKAYRKWGNKYPEAGYGKIFREWLKSTENKGIESFGNGSAMRVSPTGWIHTTLNETIKEAEKSSIVSHNHMQGMIGAKVVAGLIFMARTGATKEEMLEWAKKFYILDFTLDEIRPTYKFSATCQGSVPQAIRSFYESKDFESCIRNAVSLGGDADTLAAVAGSIAEAYSYCHEEYKIPQNLIDLAVEKCPTEIIDMVKKMPEPYSKFNYNF